MHAAQSALFLPLLATLTASAFAGDVQTPMGQPAPGLTAGQLDRFAKGRLIFDKPFSPAEGRGPVFNDGACNGCHNFPKSGGSSSKFVTRFGVAATQSSAFDPLDSLGGSLLQAEANDPQNCQEVVPQQATVAIHRTTPPCFGFGLLEAITDSAILALEANPPAGISGKAHWVQPLESPLGPQRVGRFGWKAQVATILTFSGDAAMNEMGLTNRLAPADNAPNGDALLLAACDTVSDPEDGPDVEGFDAIDRMTDFQRYLAAPPQTPRSGMTGETIFNAIGCADCHVRDFTTGTAPEVALSNKAIKPYSDFLLHDAGTGDEIWQGMATGAEFRTTPLWGLLSRAQNSLLHDGSASGGGGGAPQNVETAILAHGNEAAASVAGFNALSSSDKTHLINFLLSLGQLEFDFERDHDIDEIDWFFIEPFMSGPTPAYSPDQFEAINDVDQDGDFDMRDVGAFQRGFTGS
jgi:CxxC motif-containing protein (DUF1111 family)